MVDEIIKLFDYILNNSIFQAIVTGYAIIALITIVLFVGLVILFFYNEHKSNSK